VFIVFVLLLASVFRISTARPAGRLADGRRLAGWAEGLRSGLTGFLVAGCFISAQYEKMLWLAVFRHDRARPLRRRARVAERGAGG